jgi:hypothetical protein
MAQGSAKKQHLTVDRLSDVYLFGETVYFTSSGTFDKGDYPGLRAVRVRLVAGGGGSGGVSVGSAGVGESGGGGGGGYTEKLILASALSSSETVTVGTGGSAGSAGGNGGTGGTSSFGSHCSATGGTGGVGDSTSGSLTHRLGGRGGSGSGGDINFDGEDGGPGLVLASGQVSRTCHGGGTSFAGRKTVSSSTITDGSPGRLYGGGAVGAIAVDAAARDGAAGAAGIVIVELYF